jgi:hypothetical protein
MTTNKAYWKNPEKYRKLQRNYWRKKYNESHEFRKSEQLRANKWVKTTAKGRYSTIKKRLKVKNKSLTITQQEFIKWYKKQPEFCFYCNKPDKKENLEIDRLDNKKSYQVNNIKFACHECNSVKGEILSMKEMQVVGKLIMEKRWKKKI